MTISSRPQRIISIGFLFLVMANLSRYFLHPSARFESLSDGLTGLFYGIAISCLLLGIARTRHSNCSPGSVSQ